MLFCLLALASSFASNAATNFWTGASGVDTLWATPGNWNPSGPPGLADTAMFTDTATGADAFTANNVVSANTTVTGLNFTNSVSGTWHVTQIAASATLTVTGPVLVGGGPGGGVTTSVAMTDGGASSGTLIVTGAAMTLGNGNTSTSPKAPGTLDLSALANFVYNSTSGIIGLGTTGSRSEGNLTLAYSSNSITAATININGATGTGSTPTFNLGTGTNNLNVNTFNVGGGRSTTTLQFLGGTGGLRLRGTGGSDADRTCPVAPAKIVCVGLNYRAHAAEMGHPLPAEPVIFLKPPTACIGPWATIVRPPESRRVDHEAELAVVIGRRIRSVTQGEAAAAILGYTCANDITARDLQARDGQWTRAKSFDTFCPLGPWVVAGIDPGDLAVEAFVNGERRQASRTSDLIFGPRELVSFVSGVMTLEPGDVILTGTPAGVGPIAAGDVVEIRIEGIGSLFNPVI